MLICWLLSFMFVKIIIVFAALMTLPYLAMFCVILKKRIFIVCKNVLAKNILFFKLCLVFISRSLHPVVDWRGQPYRPGRIYYNTYFIAPSKIYLNKVNLIRILRTYVIIFVGTLKNSHVAAIIFMNITMVISFLERVAALFLNREVTVCNFRLYYYKENLILYNTII